MSIETLPHYGARVAEAIEREARDQDDPRVIYYLLEIARLVRERTGCERTT